MFRFYICYLYISEATTNTTRLTTTVCLHKIMERIETKKNLTESMDKLSVSWSQSQRGAVITNYAQQRALDHKLRTMAAMERKHFSKMDFEHKKFKDSMSLHTDREAEVEEQAAVSMDRRSVNKTSRALSAYDANNTTKKVIRRMASNEKGTSW